jgi:hypothetical protein
MAPRIGGNLDDVGSTADLVSQHGSEAAAEGDTFATDADTAVVDFDTIWSMVETRFATLVGNEEDRAGTRLTSFDGADVEGGGWQSIVDANAAQAERMGLFRSQAHEDMGTFKTQLRDWCDRLNELAGGVRTVMASHDEHSVALSGLQRDFSAGIQELDDQVASAGTRLV